MTTFLGVRVAYLWCGCGCGLTMCRGLWSRSGFARRGDEAGEELRRDCKARQVPRRPFPATKLSSDGGGVDGNRRVAAKRDLVEYCRDSHDRAEGSNIVKLMTMRYWITISGGSKSV